MPEGPVVKTWAHRLRAKRTPREVQGRFILYPRCFKRANDYETCTVEREADYEPASDCPVDVRDEHTFPSEIDRFRSKDQSWEYLLDSHLPGPLHIGVRGSILAVAAGHHLWLVDFMTDGNVMSVSTADYRAIAARSQDVPGTGGEDDDTEQPRSFAIPDQYKDPQSAHPEALRRLNIFFAFECSDDTVWLFVDHTRLIRFHVFSRGVPWTAADLNPDSQIWTYAWAHSYGPDWFAADDDVLLPLLDQWRDNLIVDVTLGHYSTVPIADAIADDTVYFNGFGEHTATDLLHEAGILPHMPLWVVATDNYIFGQLRQRITVYSAAFKDPHFVKACGQGSSDPNPFFFNEHADNNYITQYVRVYQREVTCLSGFLYNVLAAQGLFDTEHTIWSPYLHQASNFTEKRREWSLYGYTGGTAPTYRVSADIILSFKRTHHQSGASMTGIWQKSQIMHFWAVSSDR
ncbi:hypothetical protein BC629DRAFT_1702289 [Irpex lacteus]|nr:hypothetical protein BC629DRAFT_1702289 [Irpex lacteus]